MDLTKLVNDNVNAHLPALESVMGKPKGSLDNMDDPAFVAALIRGIFALALVVPGGEREGFVNVKIHSCFKEETHCRNALVAETGEGLRNDLRKAYTDRNWEPIWSHDALRSPPPVYLRFEGETIANEGELSAAIVKAWNLPFSGVAHHNLYNIIIDMIKISNRSGKLSYSNTVSVFQSSGTGKSRMVDEQGNFVFTIPINLRHPRDEYQLAYPPADAAVRDFFITSHQLTDFEHWNRYHHFFSVLFEYAKQCVQNYRKVYGSGYYEFLKHWKDTLMGPDARAKVYSELVTRARENVEVQRKLFYETASSLAEQTILENCMQPARIALQNLITELDELVAVGLLPDTPRSRGFKVLIYFDEFHDLATTKSRNLKSGSQKSLHNILLSVLNDYLDWPIFAIFMSTTSHIAPLTPAPRDLSPPDFSWSQVPITEVPFDCSPALENLGPDVLTRDQVSDVMFMANFGRPLFWTMLKELGSHFEGTILQLARAKLVNTNRFANTDMRDDRVFTKTARLAVLDTRLCLDYGPAMNPIVKKNTEEMVARHMRLAFSVPEHRQYFISGYSSEPILIEAAMWQLDAWRDMYDRIGCYPTENKPVVPRILWECLNLGLLNPQKLGDTVPRILLTDAYDRAVRKMGETTQERHSHGTHCSVNRFFEALFTNSEEILTVKPDNIPPNHSSSLSLNQLFRDATIRITHWVKSEDDHYLTTEAMAAAYIRGFAFICCDDGASIDLVIPVLLWDTVIGSSAMTAIFIQVKQRKSFCIDAANDLRFFAHDCEGSSTSTPLPQERPRPYITLIMDLGVQSYIPGYATSPQVSVLKTPEQQAFSSSTEISEPPRRKRARVEPTPQNVHPRFAFHISGCSSRTYAGIRSGDEYLYRNLLHPNEMMLEHPRPQMAPALLNMKPFLHVGAYGGWFHGHLLGEDGEMTKEAEALWNKQKSPKPSQLTAFHYQSDSTDTVPDD
ncbi:hypothetical protein BDP27DRAFT_1455214 [Rhodocollybia butyracea]|uniref:Uncharacterized protein n=1 Tax=Rhodocollybia butyracea TaxID=206335 RepID=A0A9P5P5Q5_9AGAR|nr:hypothetical protein BDP27DRAFT_1455214 [Rhodocollybia butyracea]